MVCNGPGGRLGSSCSPLSWFALLPGRPLLLLLLPLPVVVGPFLGIACFVALFLVAALLCALCCCFSEVGVHEGFLFFLFIVVCSNVCVLRRQAPRSMQSSSPSCPLSVLLMLACLSYACFVLCGKRCWCARVCVPVLCCLCGAIAF